MCVSPPIEGEISFAFGFGELLGDLVVWGDFDFECLDDAAGVAVAVGYGGEVSGCEGVVVFVFPFPER